MLGGEALPPRGPGQKVAVTEAAAAAVTLSATIHIYTLVGRAPRHTVVVVCVCVSVRVSVCLSVCVYVFCAHFSATAKN